MERLQSIYNGIEGLNLKGVFVPSNEWDFVQLIETNH